MEELQKAVDAYGIGISVSRLVDKMYFAMQGKGYNVYTINERYLAVNGVEYMFIKSRKHGKWIVKEI